MQQTRNHNLGDNYPWLSPEKNITFYFDNIDPKDLVIISRPHTTYQKRALTMHSLGGQR